MIKEKEREKILNELPIEINGFKRRLVTFSNSCTIIYSKNADLLLKNIKSSETRIKDLNQFSKDLLYEVSANTIDQCVLEMKQKIYLNEKVKKDFPKNIIIGFSTNYKRTIDNIDYYYKLFEVYLVLDTNSNSQFFSIVTVNPLFDVKYILEAINNLKKHIKNKSLINLSTEEFDYSEFNLPIAVHLYSNDFKQKKEEIKTFFKTNKWNVKFRDKYFFEKQQTINNPKIILCEGNNVDMLNNLNIENVLFSMEHNSVSIFQNIKTKKINALRDKDYLLKEEIIRLKRVFPKYCILDYYCIENYLYHPENLEELNIKNFNKSSYIQDITNQKELNKLLIISNFKGIRKGYKELTENHIKEVKDSDKEFINDISSNVFETFYQHFDMKSIYKKNFLQKFRINESILSSTKWFRSKIENIIKQS